MWPIGCKFRAYWWVPSGCTEWMLAAVTYTYQGQHYEIHFKHDHAMLPVKLRQSGVS